MRQVKRALWIVMVLSLVLPACNSGSGAGTAGSQSEAILRIPLTLEQAEQVAETFLTAWASADYATMYGLVSPNSRDAYAPEAFIGEYTDAAALVALGQLEARVTSSLRQENTASIMYDVTFHSQKFGDITDTGRIMQLVETPEGWRIAWARTDIFPELVEGAHFSLIKTQPNRGNIYDRNGQVLVDQNGRAIELYLVKRDIADPGACITELARILPRDPTDVQAQFDLVAPETLFMVGVIDPDTFQAEQQALLTLCDVGDDTADTKPRNTRRYVESGIAPHIIGFVGQITPDEQAYYEARDYPPDAVVGQMGIEQSYEPYLAGKIGARLEIVSAGGQTLRVIGDSPPEPGQSVYLTLDRDFQAAVQQALEDAYAAGGATWATQSKGAAAVVLNVKTGEILAMASYPSFDPNLFSPESPVTDRIEQIQALENDPRTPLLNRPTQAALALGSVFKIVSMAAGLESGVYTEDTGYACGGAWSYEGDTRYDWYRPGHGWLDLKGGLTNSCDPYFWQLGFTLHNADPTLLEKYAHLMGLGVSTGQTDLVESVGQIPNDEIVFRVNGMHWRLADSLNLVIGQGEMQVTPLQVARMVAAVANGGKLWKPLLISKIQLIGDEPVYTAQPTPTNTLDFDPHTLELIREAMCDVTLQPYGTARYIFEPWYKFQKTDVIVCGKTGTAQTGGKGVRPQAWFAAFAPQNDPEIAVVVVVENSCEGSEVAAPIVARIVGDYYGMPPFDWPSFWKDGCFSLGE